MHEAQGNPHLARGYYQTAARLNPSSTEAVISLARVMSNAGDASGATQHLKNALERNPDSAELHYRLGQALGDQDQIDAAMSELDAAIGLDANLAGAHHWRGKLLLTKRQDVTGALASLKTAVDLEPDNPIFLTDYGAALIAGQQVDAALAALNKAAATPGYADPVGLFNLGRAQLAKQDFSGAVATLQRSIAVAPPHWGVAVFGSRVGQLRHDRGRLPVSWRRGGGRLGSGELPEGGRVGRDRSKSTGAGRRAGERRKGQLVGCTNEVGTTSFTSPPTTGERSSACGGRVRGLVDSADEVQYRFHCYSPLASWCRYQPGPGFGA